MTAALALPVAAESGSVPPLLTFTAGESHVHTVPVALDRLIASRMLIQANSGGGKSRALRYLLEQTHGRVPQLVLDPEGEFASLRERFPYVLAGREGDVPAQPKTASLLCRRLIELGASAVLDLYDLSLRDRRRFVRSFLETLMHLPRSAWRPLLVVIDEAHVFAPERGSGEAESTGAVITLATQGRKRGYCLVAATQRLSKLHKDAAAELLNTLIGRTGLDVDVKRAGDALGFDKEQRAALKHLQPGTFYAVGPAIATEVTLCRTGDVQTTHPEAGALGHAPPPPPDAIAALLAQLADLPRQADEEARTVEQLRQQNAELGRKLRHAERHDAVRVVERPVIDQRAIDRAVTDALRAPRAQRRELRQRVASLTERSVHLAESLRTSLATVEAMHAVLAPLVGIEADTGPSAATIATASDTRALPAAPAAHPVGSAARPARMHELAGVLGVDPAAVPIHGARHADVGNEARRVSGPQQRMLNALASFAALGVDALHKSHVAVFSDQSPRSSGFEKNCSTLRSAGLLDYPAPGMVTLTEAGREQAESSPAVATLDDLHEAWLRKVSGPQGRMLRALIASYPVSIGRERLAELTGQSPRSSGWEKNLSTLRSLGLLDYPDRASAVATAVLFPAGLR